MLRFEEIPPDRDLESLQLRAFYVDCRAVLFERCWKDII